MTPETLREWADGERIAPMFEGLRASLLAHADAWEKDIAEKHELARMHANEYGNLKIANANTQMLHAVRDADALRKRLKAAAKELALHEGKEVDGRMMFHLCDNCSGAVDEKLGEIRNGLRKRLEEAESLVREVARSGVEFEDPRVRHVTVQIDVDTWRGCVAALAGEKHVHPMTLREIMDAEAALAGEEKP